MQKEGTMKYLSAIQDKDILTITINRPRELNALNIYVLEELESMIDSIDTSVIRCLIIMGSGQRAFVAGADIYSMKEMNHNQAYEFSQFGSKVFSKVASLPIPTVAAINGYALGGGCELALACDIRIASDDSIFGQPEVSLGIIPGFGGTQRLSRLVGISKAKELIFTGKKINADEALKIGLINTVCVKEELIKTAHELARSISRNAPIAIKEAKKTIDDGYEMDLKSSLELENTSFSNCFETIDQVEGMSAFLEKRKHNSFIGE